MKRVLACLVVYVVVSTQAVAQRIDKLTEDVQLAWNPCMGPCGGGNWSAIEYEVKLRISPINPGYPLPLNAPEDEGCTTTVRYRKIECTSENQTPKRTAILITGMCTTCIAGDIDKAVKNALLRLLAKDNPGGLLRTTDGSQEISFTLAGCWSEYKCTSNQTSDDKECLLPCQLPSQYTNSTRYGCCILGFGISRLNCDYVVQMQNNGFAFDYNPTGSNCATAIAPSVQDCMNAPGQSEYSVSSTPSQCDKLCFSISASDIEGINAEYEEYP